MNKVFVAQLCFMVVFHLGVEFKLLAETKSGGDLCEDLHKAEQSLDYSPSLKDYFQALFFPEDLIETKSFEYLSRHSRPLEANGKQQSKTNYIFLFQPSGEVLDYSQLDLIRTEYKELQEQIVDNKSLYLNLKDQPNLEACKSVAAKNRSEYQQLNSAALKIIDLHEYRRYLEYQSALKYVKKIKNTDLKPRAQSIPTMNDSEPLRWQVVNGLSPVELKRILNSRTTGHVIILAHADQSGRIYDDKNRPLHKTYFKKVNPEVLSVNIFSCYSKEVFAYYGMKRLLETAQFSRFIATIKSEYKEGALSVVNAFPSFVRDIEGIIDSHPDYKPIVRSNKLDEYLRLDLDFSLGSQFTVVVNGIYLTEAMSFFKQGRVDIPLFYLRLGSNEITLEHEAENNSAEVSDHTLKFRTHQIQTRLRNFELREKFRQKIYFNVESSE